MATNTAEARRERQLTPARRPAGRVALRLAAERRNPLALVPDRISLERPTAAKVPPNKADTRRSWWDVLVFSTPILDQLQQAWVLAAQGINAAATASKVPGIASGIASSPAAGILGKVHILGAVERALGSGAFQAVARVLSSPAVQTIGRVAGRVAPFIAAGFAFFDIRTAYRTQHDPKASDLRKNLKWLKAGLSTVAAGASVATLVLAPTGVGALVAGAVALGAGLASVAVDFITSRFAPQ